MSASTPITVTRPTGVRCANELRLVRLGRVARVFYGASTPPPPDPDGVPLVRATDLHNGRIAEGSIMRVAAAARPGQRELRLKTDDIIIVRSGAYTGDSAIVPASLEGALAGYDMVIRVTGAEPRYVAWHLLAPHIRNGYFGPLCGRAAQPHLNAEELVATPLYLPDREDQRYLADLLDRECARIDAMVGEQERVIVGLEEARAAAVGHLLCGDELLPDTEDGGGTLTSAVPAMWRRTRLKFLGEVRGGVTKGRQLDASATVRVPYLRVANVQDGYLDLSDIAEIEVDQHEVDRYRLRPGDVLMNEGGDNDKLGRGSVWRGELPLCLHQNHVFAFRPHDLALSEWVTAWTRTASAKAYFERRAKQTTNLASISATNIGNLPILVPPAEERGQLLHELRLRTTALDDCLQEGRRVGSLLMDYRFALVSAAVTGQLASLERA